MTRAARSRPSTALSAAIPALLAGVSFALALICVLAGRRPGYFENYSLITVNTSRIGAFEFNSSSRTSSFLHLLPSSVSTNLQHLTDSASNKVAKALGVRDFYSVHLLTFCEGEYAPNSTDPATAHKNVSQCSNETAGYSFNPSKALQQDLVPGVTLADLHWSNDIDDGAEALRGFWKASFVLYVVGLVATGIVTLTGFVAICLPNKGLIALNILLSMIGFLALGIASGIVTAAIVKASNLINKYGKVIGIAAYRGHSFLALTWASTAILFITAILWVGQCCLVRRHGQKATGHKYG